MTNGTPILGQGSGPAAGDPLYYILCQWFTSSGQGGPMVIDGYAPKLHGKPSPFSPAHVAHIQAVVKENLAKNGVLGAEVIISFMWRYEVQPSPLVDLHGGALN